MGGFVKTFENEIGVYKVPVLSTFTSVALLPSIIGILSFKSLFDFYATLKYASFTDSLLTLQ